VGTAGFAAIRPKLTPHLKCRSFAVWPAGPRSRPQAFCQPRNQRRNGTSERSGATCVLFGQTGVAKERRFEQQRGNAGDERWVASIGVAGPFYAGFRPIFGNLCGFTAKRHRPRMSRFVLAAAGHSPAIFEQFLMATNNLAARLAPGRRPSCPDTACRGLGAVSGR